MKQLVMETVFDFTTSVNPDRVILLEKLLLGIVASLFIVCLFFLIKLILKKDRCRRLYSYRSFDCFMYSLIVVIAITPLVLCDMHKLYKFKNVISNKRYHVIEGIVRVEYEQPESGHAKGDIIKINDRQLEVDHFVMTRAYKKTIAHGGVLKEGVYARLYVYDGLILRVDVREEEK